VEQPGIRVSAEASQASSGGSAGGSVCCAWQKRSEERSGCGWDVGVEGGGGGVLRGGCAGRGEGRLCGVRGGVGRGEMDIRGTRHVDRAR